MKEYIERAKVIGIGALGVFWNLMLLMSALSMMDIFPDAKKEARTDAEIKTVFQKAGKAENAPRGKEGKR